MMKTFSTGSQRIRRIFFAIPFFAGSLLARELPTYYVYHGQRVHFLLDHSSLAVKFGTAKNPAARISQAAAAGISAASVRSLDFGHWSVFTLSAPSASDSAIGRQIESLIGSQDVDFVSPVFREPNGSPVMMTPGVMVRFKEQFRANAKGLLAAISPELTVVKERYGAMGGAYLLRSSSKNGFNVLASANRLAENDAVEWAEPDMIIPGEFGNVPNDPLYSQLWGIQNTGQFGGTPGADMGGNLAWNITTGDTSVRIMIIDCGVQQNHPDIHQLPGLDFTGQGGGGGPVNSCDNHGTAVAGCASAIINNATGVVGIAPTCYVISARTLIANSTCDNTFTSQISWTINALAYAAANNIRISNFSNQFWVTSSALEAEYQQTHDSSGMVHFAAAGNGSTSVYYPASIPVVNAVGAINAKGVIASFSNHGPALDFTAPGDSIWTTDRTGSAGYTSGDYVLYRGTSFASPYAAGVAALILSEFPSFTSSQVEQKMRNSAVDLGTPGYDTIYGWGFINAYNAVRSSCLLTPPANISVTLAQNQCSTVVNFPPPTSSGNCGPITCMPPSGSVFTPGTTTVVCTDTSGDQCTFTVTVSGGGYNAGVLRDDFNRTNGPLPGSGRWVLIQNQPNNGSMAIVNNAIQPTSSAGNYNFGGVAWDTLEGGGSEASVTVAQKSGNYSYSSFFIYARMNNEDYNTGTGYRLRFQEQSGTDLFEIHRVGPGYPNSTVLASANHEINPGDVVTFRVLCDNQTMVGLVNGVQFITAKDAQYTPSQWYFALRAAVFPTPVRLDNFTVTSQQPATTVPPPTPGLLAPANGSTGQPTTPTLSWNAASTASEYHVQVATDSAFSAIILDDPTITTTSRQIGPLSGTTTYYWHVSASNAGGSSPYSAAWNFTTTVLPPPTPVLQSPSNNSTGQPATVTLRWSPSSGATGYRVQAATDSIFASKIVDDSTVTDTTRILSGLANSTSYYWRVLARNAGGASSFSGGWKFTTVMAIPATPTLLSPVNGATGQPTTLTLSWNSSAGASVYHLQAATDSLFISKVVDDSTVTTTSRLVSSLSGTTVYYWRVKAGNSAGTSAYSAAWSFTTSAPAPPPPSLTAPANASSGLPTGETLRWSSATGATGYRVQLATDSLFATLVLNDSAVTDTSRTVGPLANATKYYWHVSASNSGGSSPFTAPWNFTTIVGIPPAPVLLSPSTGSACQPSTLTLTWAADHWAASYHVQVSGDSAFGSPVVDDSGVTATSLQISSLMGGSTYYWHVSATDTAGTSPYSGSFSFTTFPAGVLRDDFNRADGPLPGSNDWVLILNQPSSGSMAIVNGAIQPTSAAGNYNFGGVAWDTLMNAPAEASVTVVQKSGNYVWTSLFIYAKMNNLDYNTGVGYRLRYFEQSGTDILEIHRVGTGYPNSTTLASAAVEIHPGDVITFRVGCDNKTLTGLVNGVPVISVFDSAYMPAQWYFAVRSCVFPTPFRADNFTVTSQKPTGVASRTFAAGEIRQLGSTTVQEYALEQNYPNPFNPSTSIRYALPVSSQVTVRIYNTLGEVVSLPIAGVAQAAGYWSIEFNAGFLASGVYFYRLDATSEEDPARTFTQVRKMLLLR